MERRIVVDKFEMIIVIANAGFSGEVMDVARASGAMGGTVVHARGTGRKEAEETFKITVNPEKDLIIIAVNANVKDDVLKAIYDRAGLNTEANAVAFSVPIDSAVGIK